MWEMERMRQWTANGGRSKKMDREEYEMDGEKRAIARRDKRS